MIAALAANAVDETPSPSPTPLQAEEHAVEGPTVYTRENTANCKPPFYPKEARRAGLEGTTVLLVLVDARGRASQAKIESSSGSELLDIRAAACMLREGKFKPAMANGKPVETWQRIGWNWKLTP
jgi:protein TonB